MLYNNFPVFIFQVREREEGGDLGRGRVGTEQKCPVHLEAVEAVGSGNNEIELRRDPVIEDQKGKKVGL